MFSNKPKEPKVCLSRRDLVVSIFKYERIHLANPNSNDENKKLVKCELGLCSEGSVKIRHLVIFFGIYDYLQKLYFSFLLVTY